MTYATQQGLIDRFGEATIRELTDRGDPPAGAIDADVVARALTDTDAVIDGYLRTRYQTPLAEVPPQIADIAFTIAVYKLHRWEPDAKIARDYADAQRALREIADGKIRLTATLIAPTETGGTGARLTDRARPFTADNMTGFI